MSYLHLITAPTSEPVTLGDAKATLRVDHDDDDTRIQRHIREAREWVEVRIQKKLASATWESALDAFPSDGIVLTTEPVQSITSIKYDDPSLVEQTVAPADYTLNDATVFPVTIWPTAYDRDNAVRVRFVAGYASVGLIPAVIIAAIHLKIKELYDGDDVEVAIHRLLTNYYQMVA